MNLATQIKIKWLNFCSEKTDWENRFLCDIELKGSLTERQSDKVTEIYEKMRETNGVIISYKKRYRTSDEYLEKSNIPFCHKHDVSYDDVHDFDR